MARSRIGPLPCLALAVLLTGVAVLGPRSSPHRPVERGTRRAPRIPSAPLRGGASAPRAAVPAAVAASLRGSDDAARRSALAAAMREWGRRDLAGAVQWAFEQDAAWSRVAIEAALVGAASRRPDLAAQLAKDLLAADPALGGPPASALVQAFVTAGRIDLASEVAAAAPPDLAADLTVTAYAQWAAQSPGDALAAAGTISDPGLSRTAWLATVRSWAATDPADLARRAWEGFSGEDRGFALRQAIVHWAQQDNAGLTRWLQSIPEGPDRTSGEYVARQFAAYGPGASVF